MKMIYLPLTIAVMVLLAFVAGRSVGAARCRANVATQSAQAQIQIIKQTEKINENVLRTNLGDIRRVMREKYTIAE